LLARPEDAGFELAGLPNPTLPLRITVDLPPVSARSHRSRIEVISVRGVPSP
jgi:hypothetical protein